MTYIAPDLITDRSIRFGVVGCGRIAKNHFNALKEHSNRATIEAVCDTDAQALADAVKETGAKGYGSIEAMLAESEVDVAVLTTPSGVHPLHSRLSSQAGRHVLTEKPMATQYEDGVAMVKAAEAAKKQLFVVKQNRKNATLQLLKRTIDKGRFGRIYMVNINVFWTRPQDYYDAASWRGTWAMDGGAFMNQASHYVDLVDWLIGPVDKISAFTDHLARTIEAEDTGVAAIKWKSGAMGSLNVTMLTYPKNLEGSITIIGEKGTVRVGGVAVNDIQEWQFAQADEDDALVKDASYETTSVYGFGHPLYYANVLDVLQGKAEPYTNGYEGLKSLEVLSAIYQSSREGKVVQLPLKPDLLEDAT